MSLIIRLEEYLGKVRLEKACFCLTLKTGSIILGCLSFIGGVLEVTQAVMGMSDESTNAFGVFLRIFLGIFWTLTAASLLYGIHKNDPVFMLPYIINGIVQFFGNVISVVLCVVTASFIVLGGMLIVMAIQIYFFLIVSSYYMELRHGSSSTGMTA